MLHFNDPVNKFGYLPNLELSYWEQIGRHKDYSKKMVISDDSQLEVAHSTKSSFELQRVKK